MTQTKKTTKTRWTVCALIFSATTINLLDRQVLGILASDLQKKIGWTELEYGYIVSAFQFSYAIGMALVGRLLDKVGTRLGYTLSIALWSLASMAHAFVGSAWGFGIARIFLGISEAGNFPAAIKATAEWFPAKERSIVAGIINAGSNMGVIVAALAVPFLAIHWGGQTAFLATGILGMAVSAWVWLFYRVPQQHSKVSKEELAYIEQDSVIQDEPIKWTKLLSYRQLWAFTIMKFLIDPVWYFYLYWLPKFLDKAFGIPLGKLSLPLMTVYLLSDVGSIAGGWFPTWLIKRGYSLHKARRTAFLVCAMAVLPMFFGTYYTNLWIAVILVGIALAAQQAWSSNAYTLVSDLFPSNAVASVVGFGSMAGALGGVLFSMIIGWVLNQTGSYAPLFAYAASAYFIAFGVLSWLVPKIEPIR
ncbi:MFS transporter [Flectobacillus major]|uniref:MFS transporter n=1 Tax=Flectobacillus major TaxID=103 RepID=UPI0004048DD1|nr:MFS transporter [Flectobacillus major]